MISSSKWKNRNKQHQKVARSLLKESLFFNYIGNLRRSHVTSALPPGLRFEVHVCKARPSSRGSDLPQGFLAL